MTPESIPPEALLAGYPEGIAAIGERLRALLLDAVPDAQEQVRGGWHLVGYRAPRHPEAGEGRGKPPYFAYIAPERHHIHLGFEYGYAMRDPGARLEGEGITRQVRWLTFEPGDTLDEDEIRTLVREGRRIALLSRSDRMEAALIAAVGEDDESRKGPDR